MQDDLPHPRRQEQFLPRLSLLAFHTFSGSSLFGAGVAALHVRRCFKRKLQLDIEERFREMVIAAIQEACVDAV